VQLVEVDHEMRRSERRRRSGPDIGSAVAGGGRRAREVAVQRGRAAHLREVRDLDRLAVLAHDEVSDAEAFDRFAAAAHPDLDVDELDFDQLAQGVERLLARRRRRELHRGGRREERDGGQP
jgi:hypothetical protein